MTTPQTDGTDPALHALIAAAEDTREGRFAVAITMLTTGGVVSGTLIDRSTWLVNFLEQADTGEGSEHMRDALGAVIGDDASRLAFVHLENAVVQEVGLKVAFWRGRSADVIGWNIGTP